MQLDANADIRGTLVQAREAGESVILHLRSGARFTGKVGGIGEDQMIVSELEGKEFYDAIVRIEEICALEVRAR